jgi:hypothetical protein
VSPKVVRSLPRGSPCRKTSGAVGASRGLPPEARSDHSKTGHVPWFDQNDRPFVPTCLVLRPRAQRPARPGRWPAAKGGLALPGASTVPEWPSRDQLTVGTRSLGGRSGQRRHPGFRVDDHRRRLRLSSRSVARSDQTPDCRRPYGRRLQPGADFRSLGEMAMLHYKALVGRGLRVRPLSTQKVEAAVGCKAINIMTSLAIPVSRKIA